MWFTAVLLILFFATFIPAVLHARSGARLFDGEALRGRMGPTARADATGRWVLMPQSPEVVRRARRRRALRLRRRILLGLVALALISGVAAVWLGPPAWAGHAAADGLLAAYVMYLIRSRQTRTGEVAVVRRLPAARTSEPTGEVVREPASAAGNRLRRA